VTYRDRRLGKADRLRGWADKRETKATAAYEQASLLADVIPFGQPILAGHYSENRDRRYRDRIGATMDRGLEHSRKADSMHSKAANIEAAAAGAIYSDDPDAVEALEAKIVRLEAERGRIKAYNASCRKGAPNPTILDDRQRAGLESVSRVAAYQLGKHGEMPGYALSNLGATINAAKRRLAGLRPKVPATSA
jgi:hypothetical protein